MTTILLDPVDALDAALADLGHIHRRTRAGTLTETDYNGLMGRARRELKRLRDQFALEAAGGFEITDAGAAIAMAAEIGRDPRAQALLERIDGLTTGRDLAAAQAAGPRTVRGLGVIDGGRAGDRA